MRTTIRVDAALLAEAKKVAAENGQTLTAVIEEALRQRLARRRPAARRKPPRLTTVRGTGLVPGVDLDDSASLMELMERPGAPD